MLLKPLSFLRACGASFLILAGLAGSLPAVEAPALRASASTFAVTPKVGSPAVSRTPQIIHEVIGDLKTTLVLFEQGGNRLCFVTSSFGVNERNMNGAVRALVAKELGLTPEQVVAACSHNHTIPMIDIGDGSIVELPPGANPENEARQLGREFMAGLGRAARELGGKLEP
jgi:hypothetical protein